MCIIIMYIPQKKIWKMWKKLFLNSGRPEKLPDVCYSWWVLASLSIIGRLHWIDKVLVTFVASINKLLTCFVMYSWPFQWGALMAASSWSSMHLHKSWYSGKMPSKQLISPRKETNINEKKSYLARPRPTGTCVAIPRAGFLLNGIAIM